MQKLQTLLTLFILVFTPRISASLYCYDCYSAACNELTESRCDSAADLFTIGARWGLNVPLAFSRTKRELMMLMIFGPHLFPHPPLPLLWHLPPNLHKFRPKSSPLQLKMHDQKKKIKRKHPKQVIRNNPRLHEQKFKLAENR